MFPQEPSLVNGIGYGVAVGDGVGVPVQVGEGDTDDLCSVVGELPGLLPGVGVPVAGGCVGVPVGVGEGTGAGNLQADKLIPTARHMKSKMTSVPHLPRDFLRP